MKCDFKVTIFFFFDIFNNLIKMSLVFAAAGVAGSLVSDFTDMAVYNAEKNRSTREGCAVGVCCNGNVDNNVTGGEQ